MGHTTVPASDSLYVCCCSSRKLPVVIGIHGGGFEIGSAAWIPGEELIKVARDVIFISIQYRLGIWGLLTTGDDVSPGNLLYWDQHYAIRWVHDNIQYFGGNPEEVSKYLTYLELCKTMCISLVKF